MAKTEHASNGAKPKVAGAALAAMRRFNSSQRPGQVKVRTGRSKLRLHTLDDLDCRTLAAQRARDLVKGFVRDLGKHPSTARSQLAQRGALLACICEHFETQWVLGEPVDLSLYGYLAGVQRRVLCSIGLERRAKDITHTKLDHLIDAVEERVE
jgi:hypothetical protein